MPNIGDDVDFGDFDPEDAYDVGDPPEMRIAVISRVISDLQAKKDDDARFGNRRQDLRRVISNFLQEPDYPVELEDLRDDLEAL